METNDLLFVRACKSLDPYVRLETLYRRIYLSEPSKGNLSLILSEICDKYNLLSSSKMISELHPRYGRYTMSMYAEPMPYEDRVFQLMLSTLRFSNVDKFDDYIPTLKYRRAA